MRLTPLLMTLCALAAPAFAQTNSFAIFTRVTSTTSTTIKDPKNPLDVTTTSVKKSTATDWVVRNLLTNQEAVVRTATINGSRFYRVQTKTPVAPVTDTVAASPTDYAGNLQIGPVPQNGAPIPGVDPTIIPVEAVQVNNSYQRNPLSVDFKSRYEMRRAVEGAAPAGTTANPTLSEVRFISGVDVRTKLKYSALDIVFPKSMTGSTSRWEIQNHGFRPYNDTTFTEGKAIVISKSTINASTNYTLSDQAVWADFGLPGNINYNNLAIRTNEYAVRVLTYHLERSGYVNYDLVRH